MAFESIRRLFKRSSERVSGGKSGSVTDPVCGMSVDKSTSLHTSHNGVEYYFDSSSCLNRFQSNPSRYVKVAKTA